MIALVSLENQKSAIGLLSVGTFLEYFDLMLYIHMAALLNELFFEPASPLSTSLLTAFAFCSTYVLRPFGALLFGWIGDNIGRRETVIITTLMMAFSCFIVAILPTYAQIGCYCFLDYYNMSCDTRYNLHGRKNRSRTLFN